MVYLHMSNIYGTTLVLKIFNKGKIHNVIPKQNLNKRA